MVVAGGVESMTRAPWVMAKPGTPWARPGEVVDSSLGWRFANPRFDAMTQDSSMGETAEEVAALDGITREDSDAFSAAQPSARGGGDRGRPVRGRDRARLATCAVDEGPRASTSLEQAGHAAHGLPARRNRHRRIVVAAVRRRGRDRSSPARRPSNVTASTPRARVVASASARSPAASDGARTRARHGEGAVPGEVGSVDDVGAVESNEAFAAQSLAVIRRLGLSEDVVNVDGGAIALGHPLGCSGARLVVTLLGRMERENAAPRTGHPVRRRRAGRRDAGGGDLMLRSYVSGTWFTPVGRGSPVRDAVTGEGRSRGSRPPASTWRARSSHGRRVGGPALRELTFHQRAALLKALAAILREHRDELYALSARTGATLRRLEVRRRRRHRRAVHLRQQGPARAAQRHRLRRRRRRAARPWRHVRRPAHLHAAARASPCRSTRSTSRCGGRWRSSRRRSSPACRPWSSRRRRPPTSPQRLVELIVDVRAAARGRAAARLPAASATCSITSPSRTSSPSPARRRPRSGCAPIPTSWRASVRFNAEADSLNCSILGPDAVAGHAGVRPVRQAARHRDDRQGRAEVHGDPPRARAAPRCSTPWPRRRRARLAQGRRRQPGRTRRAHGRARQPRAARGGAPLAQGAAATPARHRLRRPRARRRRSTPTPTVARSCRRSCCGPTTPAEPSRTRSRRSARCSTLIGYETPHEAIELAARGQGSLVGLGRHRRRRRRPSARARRRAVARPAARARPRRRGGIDRPRLAAADARARRARARRRRRGDGRPARRAAPHAAHRGAGQPARAQRRHRPVGGRGAAARPTACTRSASRWPSCGSATPWSPGRAPSRSTTSSTSPSSPATRSTRTWTRQAAAANPFFDGRVAHGYLIVSFAAGLFVDPDPGPGAGQLRPGQPALPHAGLPGRRAHRHADLQADHPARGRRLRRGALGRRRHQAGRLDRRDVRRAHDGREDA